MADDQVLDQRLEFVWETWHLSDLGMQHFEFDDHVPEQLSARGVGKRAVVGEFMNLANIVQECAGEQQIAVDLRIVAAHQVAGLEKRDHMIEQATDVGMMQGLGSGGVAVGFGDLRAPGKELFSRRNKEYPPHAGESSLRYGSRPLPS